MGTGMDEGAWKEWVVSFLPFLLLFRILSQYLGHGFRGRKMEVVGWYASFPFPLRMEEKLESNIKQVMNNSKMKTLGGIEE